MSDESSSIATEESAPEENSAGASPLSEAAPVDPVVTLTNDLQRLQAEYQNYRKRVERDRVLTSELALAAILVELLPVLDDLERAREHGELEGGFKSVAEQIERTVEKLGLTKCLGILTTDNRFSEHLEYFNKHKKKDDLSDSFLQGMWFINNKKL